MRERAREFPKTRASEIIATALASDHDVGAIVLGLPMIAPQHEQKIVSCHDGDGIREVGADREKLEGWLKTLGGPADLMAALDDRIGPRELRRRIAGPAPFSRARP